MFQNESRHQQIMEVEEEMFYKERQFKMLINFNFIIFKIEDVFASGHHFGIQLLCLPPLCGHAIHRSHRIPHFDGTIWMVRKEIFD